MRFLKVVSVVATFAAASASAQLLAANLRNDYYLPNPSSPQAVKPFMMDDKDMQFAAKGGQKVLYGEVDNDVASKGNGVQLLMTDALGIDREISIFAGLVRQVEGLMWRLQDRSKDTLVLAPTNVVMQSLKRKPWEDEETTERGDAREEERRAMENIERFVLSHVVNDYGFDGPGERKKCGAGISDLWYESAGDHKVVHAQKASGGVKADVVKTEGTGNGQVWTINNVLT
ncbi:hypothetical protein POJ06DRAFT_265308 [Lipomyces tetrasporus]|uniref:FAS1 domain-containing protein n=1 Tax=Lipomyces tetrasporus TaxID=54092 RepID=A0AAD7VUF5_9ASCO|nr:uncharacterized protein POJ06DRAFT_265308 [Lipomyces tetrasporus]KAJ8102443.1 hypothetical protein POJ06DRAFT_265308 [Lipomyces tetrasporus]